jgi:antitoxin Phd
MIISTHKIVSVTEANQNFNKVTKIANTFGDTIIFKRNKPAFILFDVEVMGAAFLEEYEKLKVKYLSEKLIEEYA